MIPSQHHRSPIRNAALALLLSMLSACSMFKSSPPIGIEALRTQHRYVSALAALEEKRAKNPDYLQQRQALLEDATLHQSHLLQTLRGLMEQQDYAQAQQLLQQAAPELPPNAELSAFTAEFSHDSNLYVQNKLYELYQLRGEHLLKEQPLYQSLQGIAGDYDMQVAVERFQADADYFARLLRAAGTAAMERQDYKAAQKYLATAHQLRPSAEVSAALQDCTRAIEAQRERQQQTRASEREQRYQKLETALQQSIARQDFAAARIHLGNLRDIGLHGAEVDRYHRQLADAINTYVATQIDGGNKQYADGHIEAALVNWRNAYALTPTADLKERIDKAEKFMQRYQHLKRMPAAATPAP